MITQNKPLRARDYDDVERAVQARLPFKHGTCSGDYYESFESVGTGQLPDEHATALEFAFGLTTAPLYVVKSYETPIAWIDWTGTRNIPPVKYSSTTSRQQNICKKWMV